MCLTGLSKNYPSFFLYVPSFCICQLEAALNSPYSSVPSWLRSNLLMTLSISPMSDCLFATFNSPFDMNPSLLRSFALKVRLWWNKFVSSKSVNRTQYVRQTPPENKYSVPRNPQFLFGHHRHVEGQSWFLWPKRGDYSEGTVYQLCG